MIREIGQRHLVQRERPDIRQQPLDTVRWEPFARLLAAAGMDWPCGSSRQDTRSGSGGSSSTASGADLAWAGVRTVTLAAAREAALTNRTMATTAGDPMAAGRRAHVLGSRCQRDRDLRTQLDERHACRAADGDTS